VGEVVYLYAYDVAYEIAGVVPTLLGQPGKQFAAAATRRMPRDPFFYQPQMFRLPDLPPTEKKAPAPPHATVKLFPVGAFSIAVHVPFEVASLAELVAYHDLRLTTGPLHEEVRALAERVFAELRPYCIRPVEALKEDEAYTVFCVQAPLPGQAPDASVGRAYLPDIQPPTGTERRASMPDLQSGQTASPSHAGAEAWLHANRRLVAAILTQEEDMDQLSLQEAVESTNLFLSYYESDLAVIDWDAALVVDEPEDFEEVLHVMELANVQLMELGVFDQILDEAVGRAYRDLRKMPWGEVSESRRGWRGRRDVRRDLGEIRMDLERLRDELFNITKFFGDWHLARVYQHLSSRFHLAEWSRIIEGKLHTLNEFYQILKADQNNRLMAFLEVVIVVLFIIDLVVLVMGLKT
jgi:hypothetical protein